MTIGKITTPAARDDYLAPDFGIVLDHEHTLTPFARLKCTKQPRRPATDDYCVVDQSFFTGNPKRTRSTFVSPMYRSLRIRI